MAYEVHITRTNHWGKSDSNPITLEEWIAHARSDAELRFEGGVVETISPKGEKIRTGLVLAPETACGFTTDPQAGSPYDAQIGRRW
jgi:hypothetical protein